MPTNEPAWPERFPVERVTTTLGFDVENVDEAEYTDLRRQGLIKFDEPVETQQPTTPAAPRAVRNESE